jgi:beta-phosphoglucomutase
LAIEPEDVCGAKAVLFDLDGVLVRSDRLHYLAWKAVADARNWFFDERMNELLRGVPRRESLEIILSRNGASLSEEEAGRVAEEKNGIFRDLIKELGEADLVPGAKELVEGVRRLGAKTAVCSSSRNAPAILERLDLTRLFDAALSAADVAKAKPDPEIFLKAAGKLGVKPAACVVVEDAQSGVDAALAAGMRCVGLSRETPLRGASMNIASFAGLSPESLLAAGRGR